MHFHNRLVLLPSPDILPEFAIVDRSVGSFLINRIAEVSCS